MRLSSVGKWSNGSAPDVTRRTWPASSSRPRGPPAIGLPKLVAPARWRARAAPAPRYGVPNAECRPRRSARWPNRIPRCFQSAASHRGSATGTVRIWAEGLPALRGGRLSLVGAPGDEQEFCAAGRRLPVLSTAQVAPKSVARGYSSGRTSNCFSRWPFTRTSAPGLPFERRCTVNVAGRAPRQRSICLRSRDMIALLSASLISRLI